MLNDNFEIRKRCPICHHKVSKQLFRESYSSRSISEYLDVFYSGRVDFKYLEGAEYILHQCEFCKSIYQLHIPNIKLMEQLYDQWIDPEQAYSNFLGTDSLAVQTFNAKDITQLIDYFNQPASTLKFFDFGMGWGQWALMAKAFGCQSYGSELSSERINHAIANGIAMIEWDDIPNHQFDFINTEQVFEHISDPLLTLRHLYKSLNDEGIIKISVPNSIGIERKLKAMDWKAPKRSRLSLNPVAPLEHINLYRRESILEMANQTGLEETFIPILTQYTYTNNWKGITQIAKNIVLPIFLNVIKNRNYIFLQKKNENKHQI